MKKIALLLVIISLLAIFLPSLAFAEEVNPEIENNSLIPEKYRTFLLPKIRLMPQYAITTLLCKLILTVSQITLA